MSKKRLINIVVSLIIALVILGLLGCVSNDGKTVQVLDPQGNLVDLPTQSGVGSQGQGIGDTEDTGQGFSWRGSWLTGSSYSPYDVVTNAGSCYQCILAVINSTIAPNNDSTHFSLFCSKGDTGPNNITTSTTTNGIGFLKGNGSVISFDNSSYVTGTPWTSMGYITSYTETDPLWSSSISHGISAGDITNWNSKLSSYTEIDPLWVASVSHGIIASDITNWNGKLSSITGTNLDNIFSSNGFLKRTGIGTYTVDTNTYVTGTPWTGMGYVTGTPWTGMGYLTGNQSISLGGILSGSGTTSITASAASGYYMPSISDHSTWDAKLSTVTGTNLDNVFSTTGLLKRTGANTYTTDSRTYITGNQSITLSGVVAGTGTTAITTTYSSAPSHKTGITTRDISLSSGTQVIAHGLGRTPVCVHITGELIFSAAISMECKGIYDGTNHSGMAIIWTEGTTTAATDNMYTSTSAELGFSNAGATNPFSGATKASGVITVDGTNITITWTKSGSPTGTANLMWEVE